MAAEQKDGMRSISIVIPTFNAVGQVEGLLTRLVHFHNKYGDDCQLIITDDCSGDGTPQEITRQFPEVEVLKHGQNSGFGINVMRGVAKARNEYLAIINSDIELVGNPFKELTEALENDGKLLAAMPLVFNRSLEKVENLARLYCRRGLCWHTELPEEEQWSSTLRDLLTGSKDTKSRLRDLGARLRPIRSVLCGAAFVCRRDRFNQLNGFDPLFSPFYWEDVDLDYRARERGWHCAVVPSTAVIHRHSESINRHFSGKKEFFLLLNQLRFVHRHRKVLPDLVQPHLWWTARALRECCGGNPVLRRAYWRAGLGMKDF